jgi:hypothetical protein
MNLAIGDQAARQYKAAATDGVNKLSFCCRRIDVDVTSVF